MLGAAALCPAPQGEPIPRFFTPPPPRPSSGRCPLSTHAAQGTPSLSHTPTPEPEASPPHSLLPEGEASRSGEGHMEEASGAGRVPLSTQLCLRRQKCTSTPSRRSGSRPCRAPPRRFWVRHASSPPSPPPIFLGLGDTPPSPPPPARPPPVFQAPGPPLPASLVPPLRPRTGLAPHSQVPERVPFTVWPFQEVPPKDRGLAAQGPEPRLLSGARDPPLPSLQDFATARTGAARGPESYGEPLKIDPQIQPWAGPSDSCWWEEGGQGRSPH